MATRHQGRARVKASISTKVVTNELTLTLEGLNWEDLQQASFYVGEVEGRELLKVIGQEMTAQLRRSKDGAPPTLQWEGQTYYRKAAVSPRRALRPACACPAYKTSCPPVAWSNAPRSRTANGWAPQGKGLAPCLCAGPWPKPRSSANGPTNWGEHSARNSHPPTAKPRP